MLAVLDENSRSSTNEEEQHTSTTIDVVHDENTSKAFQSRLQLNIDNCDSSKTWAYFMGQVNFLFGKFSDAKIIINEYDEQEIVNEKLSVLKIINSLLPIKGSCEKPL